MEIINVNGVELPTPKEDGMEFEEEDLQVDSYRSTQTGKLHKKTIRESTLGLTVSWDELTAAEVRLIRSVCKGHGEYVTVRYYSDSQNHAGEKTMYSGNLKYTLHRIDPQTGEGTYKNVSMHFAEQ